MNNTLNITDAEYYVMKTIWSRSPMNASEIIESLKDETDWNPKTIHTLISRLVSKKAVGVIKESPYRFYPLVLEGEYRREETRSFLKKVYNGSIQHLVANFINDEAITKEELEELKRLLDDKGREE